jgi:hypothetical protein
VKNGECAACLKYSVLIFVEKIHKMQNLEGSGTPVLYIWDAGFLKVKFPPHQVYVNSEIKVFTFYLTCYIPPGLITKQTEVYIS